jgi:hypothetical protein
VPTRIWLGAAQATAQVNTITPANVGIGNVFTVTINGKSVSFTATAATVANVTAGLAAALEASTEPEFSEITWTDSTTHVTATGLADGAPFTQTSTATGGTATLTTLTTVNASSPNHWSVAANWSGAAVPASTDTVIVSGDKPDILYGLAQSAVTLASLTVGASYSGAIGLPDRNLSGGGYNEYRPTYLAISATAVSIGGGFGQGSGRIKLDTGTAVTTVNVQATGAPAEPGVEAFLWKGSNTANVLNVVSGSVGVAVLPAEVAEVVTLRIGGGTDAARPQVRLGTGVTLTNVTMEGGDVLTGSGAGTITKIDGVLTVTDTAAVTTLHNDGGTLYWQSSGTITTLNTGNDGVSDFSRDLRPRTVTNSNLHAGGTINDPMRTVTWTNGVVLVRCNHTEVTLNLGTHITTTVAAGP